MRKHIIAILAALTLLSCSEDDDNTSSIRFESTATSVSEADDTYSIKIVSGTAVTQDTEIYFELSGSAALNGDYEVLTPSPVTIEAGETSASITLRMIDESVIESADAVTVTLSAAGQGSTLSGDADDLTFTLTIEDNDDAPNTGVQVDLVWTTGEGEDVNAHDLNLYLANNVEISDNSITYFELFTGSEADAGFESVWLDDDSPDGDYYIVVSYYEGSGDIDFTFTLNGAGYDDEIVDGTFTADEVSTAAFYGPVTKSGSDYGRRATSAREKMRIFKIRRL